MSTLVDLKNKWFIPMDGTSPCGVPCRRHTTTATSYDLAVSTDGNIVTPLIDGKDYMKAWYDGVVSLHGVPGAELFLSGWRLEGVKTLGMSTPSSDALDCLDDADENGVFIRILLSDHMSGLNLNQLSSTWLLAHGIVTMLDNRFPAAGSNHFKYSIFKRPNSVLALLGSIDISKTRWDDSRHLTTNPERTPPPLDKSKPTHDTGVMLQGPAVKDLELLFRERWNDPGYAIVFPNIDTPVSSTAVTGGSHSIQVLRTYGITEDLAYTWSPRGEFTVWAAYLNAIKKATQYIYIEDQYFLPFDWPPVLTKSGPARDTDLFFQLGEAMKNGVRIFVLTPSNAEDFGKGKSKYQRDIGINYLRSLKTAGASGDILVASLQNGTDDVYVHSKLMIVDDELVLIGSANFGQRAMTCDGEVQLAIVDANNTFARDFRIALWSEHLTSFPDLNDPIDAYDKVMVTSVASKIGHLKPYPADDDAVYPWKPGLTAPERGHSFWMRNIFDPYYGPESIRRGGTA